MPFAIDPADRKLLLIAAAVLLVLGVALCHYRATGSRSKASRLPSIYSSRIRRRASCLLCYLKAARLSRRRSGSSRRPICPRIRER